MRVGRKGLNVALVLLFIGAVWVRVENLGDSAYSFYTGESGTNFRQSQQIARRGALPPVDRYASWPEGYSPSRVKPNGVEYLTGYAYRLVHPFSDVSEKKFSGILTVLFFSLSVFTLYALTRRIWGSQAAGVFAAFLVAFSGTLVNVTNGKEYLHAPYAFFVISLHIAIFAGCVARWSVIAPILMGLVAFALLGVWNAGGLYIVMFGLVCLLFPGLSSGQRRWILAVHAAAALLGGIALPHLRAGRFVFDWPTVWMTVIALYAFVGDRLPRRVPGWVYVSGAFVVVTLALKPLRSGGESVLDPLVYWFYRIRFLSGRPDDPGLLPDAVRVAWTQDHAPPTVYNILAFSLPLVLLVPGAIGALREIRKARSTSLWIALVPVVLGAALFFVDQRAIFAAALVAFPFVSGALRGFARRLKTRAAPAVLAAALVLAILPAAFSDANVIGLIGSRLGLSPTPKGFARVSIGNADRELVRFIVTRTSTRNDVFFAPPAVSSLVVTFAGRSTVVAPGVFSGGTARKVVETLSGFYRGEKDFYAQCEALGATYVLYSIDILLDGSSYSPRYLAGVTHTGEKPVAYAMHFAPETLRHFQLVYENDNYRLFRVTADIRPVYLTDHPPVYQEEILRTHGGDLEAFYARIFDILTTYQTAIEAQARGDEEGAIRRFRYCLDQAPFFTKARIGMGDSLLRLGKPEEAYAVYGRVLEYAPDDGHALYYGALSLAYTGRKDDALRLIDLLLSSTAERETLSQALELKTALESGRRLKAPWSQ